MNLRLLWLAALLAVVVAGSLHLHFHAHAGGFWRDEVNTLNVARHDSLDEFRKDSFPVLFPLLVHGWLGSGLPETSLRVLGLIVGFGLLAALVIGGWKIHRAPPLLALTLFALNPTLIIVGDSLRAYGLGTVFIAVTTFAAAWFLLQPNWQRLALFAIAGVLSVQTLYHNAVFLGAICLGAMAVCVRQKNFRAASQVFGAGALAAVSLLPYLGGVVAGRADSEPLRLGLRPERFKQAMLDTFGYPNDKITGLLWLVLFIGLLLHGVRTWRTLKPEAPDNSRAGLPLFSAVTLTAGLFGYLGFLQLAALPSQSWYFLPVMALAAVCIDLAWPLWLKQIQATLALIFVLAVAWVAPTTWGILGLRYTNADVWARLLEKSAKPGDYVIVDPWYCGISFAHYFKPGIDWDTLPPIADHATHRYDMVKLQLQNTNAIAPVLEKISTTLRSGNRVWVLGLYGWMGIPDAADKAPPALPPAPHSQYGWAEAPYTLTWVSQMAHHIQNEADTFDQLGNREASGNFIEELNLYCAQGWRGTNVVAKP
jgi:hypothetical protein